MAGLSLRTLCFLETQGKQAKGISGFQTPFHCREKPQCCHFVNVSLVF
jgi:hypothetical protein